MSYRGLRISIFVSEISCINLFILFQVVTYVAVRLPVYKHFIFCLIRGLGLGLATDDFGYSSGRDSNPILPSSLSHCQCLDWACLFRNSHPDKD